MARRARFPLPAALLATIQDLNDDPPGTYTLNFTKSGCMVGAPGGVRLR
jgi:hypothetical protein